MLALVHRQSRNTGWRTLLLDNLSHARRCLSTTEGATKDALRSLLRETAQPVAVVTSFYPGGTDGESRPAFHGATLSSFASIALDPHPLVSFSLRIPSRMATSLRSLMQQPKYASRPSLVVNLLSSSQADVAHRFARADLFPNPFRITSHTLTEDGLPLLTGALGALTCSLVKCIPLHDLCGVDVNPGEDADANAGAGVISELFISRVVRVESTRTLTKGDNSSPLLYHHRRYATASPLNFIP